MARVTISRTPSIPLTKRHLQNLRYEFLLSSIFFEEPLKVAVPSLGEEIEVGFGLGGLSWSLFTRGEGCSACGNCCSGIGTYIWLWSPVDPKPEGLPELDLEINGTPIRYSYHIQDPPSGTKADCVYLEPLIVDGVQPVEGHGIPMRICVLHGFDDPMKQRSGLIDTDRTFDQDLKPPHCRSEPMMRAVERAYGSGRKKYMVWERTLPSRNWRWPKCPINQNLVPVTPNVFRSQQYALRSLEETYLGVKGARFAEGIQVWESLVKQTLDGNPPIETTLLEKLI